MPTKPFEPSTSLNLKSTSDTAPLPVPIAVTPAQNAKQVPINNAIQVRFDQPIKQGQGNFIISNDQGDSQIISVNDLNYVSIDDKTLTLTPLNDFKFNSDYSVKMEAGTLTDLHGRPLAEIMDSSAYTFTTQDSLALTSYDWSYYGESNVNSVLWVGFDKLIRRGSGKITLSNDQGDTQVIDVSDHNQIMIDRSGLRLDPLRSLRADSRYHVLADAGVITDLDGNASPKLTDPNFLVIQTLGDHKPPQFDVSRISANTSGFYLPFSETIKLGSGSLKLIDSQGRQTIIDVRDSQQVKLGDSFLTVQPSGGLLPNTQYQLQLDGGLVEDLVGNPLQAPSEPISFDVPNIIPPNDTTVPQIITTSPTDEQNQVALDSDILLIFNEAVSLTGSGHFILSNGLGDTRVIAASDSSQVRYVKHDYGNSKIFVDNTQLIIDPAQNLVANSRYVVQMEADTVRDLAGNPVAAIMDNQAFNFSTVADANAPMILSVTPVDNSLNVPVDANIIAVFNEPIRAGRGNITLTNELGDQFVIAVDDQSQVNFNGTQLMINPTQDLLHGAAYLVQIDAEAILDLAGNPFGAVTGPNAYNFTTAPENDAPTYLYHQESLTWPQTIQLSFNEAIKLGTGNLILSNGQGDDRTIAVSDSRQVKILQDDYYYRYGHKIVEISPTFALLPDSSYTLKIDPGAFTDISGNAFAGIQDTTRIRISTPAPDLVAPVLEGFNQYSGVPLSFRFSEFIKVGNGFITLNNDAHDTRLIDIHDSTQARINGAELYIDPKTDLTGGAIYTAQLDNGLVTDNSGNSYQGGGIITFEALFKPAANQPVQEINHGGTSGVYDNQDVLKFNFNGPVHWQGMLYHHQFTSDNSELSHINDQRLDGEYPLQFSQDGLSASITLTETSQFAHGDTVTFTGISGDAGTLHNVVFTL